MAFGISTDQLHLDPIQPAAPQPGEFAWPAFTAWYDNTYPTFAGRPFLGGKFTWSHGEGQAAAAIAAPLTHIAPIHAADPIRMAVKGDDGFKLGALDASAFCDRVSDCIISDEFSFASAIVYVFLAVPAGTALSVDYWAGWATTVWAAITVIGGSLPGAFVAPRIVIPFSPAILCSFVVGSDGHTYVPDTNVTACLGAVEAAYPNEPIACYALWAIAADNATYNTTPQPTLDWTLFPPYSQPIQMNALHSVPVAIWRYAVPPGTSWAGGNPVNLDATNDNFQTLDYMLAINGAFSITADSGFGWGFDTDVRTTADAECISQATLTYTRAGTSTPIVDGASVHFVGRYYDNFSATSPHHLSQAEASALRQFGLEILVAWQSPRPPKQSGQWPGDPAYFAAGYGTQDALDAFGKASQLGQQPHTPVYFAIDFDAQDADYPNLQQHFRDIWSGYQQYLTTGRTAGHEPTPYVVGVYGGADALDVCYRLGLVSYFWQAVGWAHGRTPWPHANVWQRTNAPKGDPTQVCGKNADFDETWGDPGTWH